MSSHQECKYNCGGTDCPAPVKQRAEDNGGMNIEKRVQNIENALLLIMSEIIDVLPPDMQKSVSATMQRFHDANLSLGHDPCLVEFEGDDHIEHILEMVRGADNER